ncbi:Structural polyprotein [Dissostichus eleginoides]|uniref:Structural polyprotein n=1 Tax=Dissostichus eleginoides TaxID=100907 RepID=A0AAD9BHH4_DISEL|nr:Structural polyprotein [Dissostichus eleginoides]
MNSMGKRRWDSMVSNSSLGYTVHGGSVPNLLSPPRSEGLGTLKKRMSMEVLRGWAPDLGSLSMGLNLNLSPVKWPSLVTVCKWKQSLAEKLKKKHCGTEDQSQTGLVTLHGEADW